MDAHEDGAGAFGEGARESCALTSRYYFVLYIQDAEIHRIFVRPWLYAGHVSGLPKTGSYMINELAGQPVSIMRSKEGNIRAFFTMCQHRGHIFLAGQGQLKSRFVRSYHTWSYGLDGALQTTRLIGDVAGFNKVNFLN